MLYSLARQLLFRFDPETAHHLALQGIGLAEKLGFLALLPPVPENPVEVMGLRFPNPVGLAAGLDKNGDCIDGLAALGFGFIEIGTVTPRPQPGNPRPRLFRLPEARAIINRMGFNNLGVDHLVGRVERSDYRGVLGINIGKNFDTPLEKAADDYLACLDKVYAHASYVTVNISSPNTKGLRTLQSGDALAALLEPLKNRQAQLASRHGRHVPLAVKIAPDLEAADVEVVAEQLLRHEIEAVIATNTTLGRAGVEHLRHGGETGGLSGDPVRAASTRVLRELASALGGKLAVIGVGGISDGASAAEKIQAGADLVQVYTGFIYEGPQLVRDAAAAIAALQHGK
ncbi:MAG TPA: quinone-dependent dihydroorotate dehydrogenase [Moraxellaceae bacterium]|nr:quinone-dependent dihydroorotate dehydrogenase [Moraxellaceae bacterium]